MIRYATIRNEEQMESRGITDAEIAGAAERIVARGERPSLRAVRAELGTGSLSTVARGMLAWRGRAASAPTTLSLPPEIQRLILAEMDRHVAAARAELGAELAAAQDDREAVVDELERTTAALAAAERRRAEEAAELERRGGAIAQLETALHEARDLAAREREAAEAARRVAALAALRLESLPELHAQLDALRSKLDDEREGRRAAEIEAAELRGSRKAP